MRKARTGMEWQHGACSTHPPLFYRSCPLSNSTVNALANEFESCLTTNLNGPLKLLVASNVYQQSSLQTAINNFTNATGIRVAITIVNSSALAADYAENEIAFNPRARDGWILDGGGLVTLATYPSPLYNLTEWIGSNQLIRFNDYTPFWQGTGPMFGGELYSLPYQGRNMLLFYRYACVHAKLLSAVHVSHPSSG